METRSVLLRCYGNQFLTLLFLSPHVIIVISVIVVVVVKVIGATTLL